MSLLSANELAIAYGWQKLLDGVTLSVSPGEKVGLVGRNGSGKTSLLKILAGAQPPDAGECYSSFALLARLASFLRVYVPA